MKRLIPATLALLLTLCACGKNADVPPCVCEESKCPPVPETPQCPPVPETNENADVQQGIIRVTAESEALVYIDGKLVTKKAPLEDFAAEAGLHSVRVYFRDTKKFSKAHEIAVKGGTETTLYFAKDENKTTVSQKVLDVSATDDAPAVYAENPLLRHVPDEASFYAVSHHPKESPHRPASQTLLAALHAFGADKLSQIFPIADVSAFAMYVQDDYMVIHIAMTDPAKLLAPLDDLRDRKQDCYPLYVNGEFQEKCAPTIQASEENGWKVYRFQRNGDILPIKLAFHLSNTEAGIVVLDAQKSIPSDILNNAPRPVQQPVHEENAVIVGRIHYPRLVQSLFTFPLAQWGDIQYLSYERQFDGRTAYGTIDAESKDKLCASGSCDYWNRWEKCFKELASHCPGQDAERPWQIDCDWYSACQKCTESERCFASMTQPIRSPGDVLKQLGKTSISDRTCIEEAQSILDGYSDFEIVVDGSPQAPGFRIATPIDSTKRRALQSKIIAHAELADSNVLARGFVGVDFGSSLADAIQSLERKFVYKNYRCSQLQTLSGLATQLQVWGGYGLSEKFFIRPELWTILQYLGTASFALKEIDPKEEVPRLWVHYTNAPSMNDWVDKQLTKYGAPELHSETHVDANTMIVTTPPYHAKTTTYTMAIHENTFVNLQMRKDLVSQLFQSRIPASDYHLFVGIENSDFVISLMPGWE